jgi:hypothetical protein
MVRIAVDQYGPKAFILVPDGEFSAFNPANDQIWSLCLDASDTCPFYLHTTYHLRAKSMRLFANISFGHRRQTKPGDFSQPPTVTSYTPGTLQIKYHLMIPLQVQFSCFITEPEIIVGRIDIVNTGEESIELDCELAAVLIPMGKGHPTHPERHDGNQILCGETDDIFPVLFMSGGPQATSNPYPALRAPLILEPGESESLHWTLASKSSQKASLDAARQNTRSNWHNAFHVQIKKHASNVLNIKTGEPDWDTAFYLAQMNAMTHLVNPDQVDDKHTFIRTRLPDQPMLTELENNNFCNLTLLDVNHLAQVILPAHVDLFSKLVESFIERVDDQGQLSSQIHRGKMGTSLNEPPILANLCLMIFEITQDQSFLNRVFPHLRLFFDKGWFADKAPDPESFPIWETPEQLQLDTGLFNFDIWEPTGKGLDIRTATSPALAAMLYREALALQKIAQILGDRTARNQYGKTAKVIHEKISSLWENSENLYQYQDHQSHLRPARELYYPGLVQANLFIDKHFIQPQRLQLHLTTHDERTRACVVRIEGRNTDGEEITEQYRGIQIRWIGGLAHLTTQNLFSYIDSIEFEGFNEDDHFLIETADFTQGDISCLLPLWSGNLPKDQLTSLVKAHCQWEETGFAYGIPETWRGERPLPDALPQQVSVLWNTLLIDGLINEGFHDEAGGIFSNMMKVIINGLKHYNGFFPFYNIDANFPKGKTNALTGLAPIGLCLKIAGIKLFKPDQVAIWGTNPFPWPIEVQWQGLWLRKEGSQTTIDFPDGSRYQSQTSKPLIVKSNRGKVKT